LFSATHTHEGAIQDNNSRVVAPGRAAFICNFIGHNSMGFFAVKKRHPYPSLLPSQAEQILIAVLRSKSNNRKTFLIINLGEAEDNRCHLFEPEGRVLTSPGESLEFIKNGLDKRKGISARPCQDRTLPFAPMKVGTIVQSVLEIHRATG
jgi:hypothetical protein